MCRGPDLRSRCPPSGPVTDWKMGVSLFDFWVHIYELAQYSILPFISPPRLNRHIVIQALMASTLPPLLFESLTLLEGG